MITVHVPQVGTVCGQLALDALAGHARMLPPGAHDRGEPVLLIDDATPSSGLNQPHRILRLCTSPDGIHPDEAPLLVGPSWLFPPEVEGRHVGPLISVAFRARTVPRLLVIGATSGHADDVAGAIDHYRDRQVGRVEVVQAGLYDGGGPSAFGSPVPWPDLVIGVPSSAVFSLCLVTGAQFFCLKPSDDEQERCLAAFNHVGDLSSHRFCKVPGVTAEDADRRTAGRVLRKLRQMHLAPASY